MLGFGAIAAGGIADPIQVISPDITIGLSGVAVSTTQGAFGIATDNSLTGQQAAYAQGALTVGLSTTLTGVTVATAQGALTVGGSLALTGANSATQQGSQTLGTSLALTGVTATASQGSIGVQIDTGTTIALPGHAVATGQGTLAPELGVGLIGAASTTAQGSLSSGTSLVLSGGVVSPAQGAVTKDFTLAPTGASAVTSLGSLNPLLAISVPGVAVALSQGAVTASVSGDLAVAMTGHQGVFATSNLINAPFYTLDYWQAGYCDLGYVIATPATIAADIVGQLGRQASPVDVVEVNDVLVTGTGHSGDTWGPAAGRYSGSYTSVGGISTISSAALAAINAASIPVNIKHVNGTAVRGTGATGDEWRPV